MVTESPRPIAPDTRGYYGVVRLSTPSSTVSGSSPALTTKNHMQKDEQVSAVQLRRQNMGSERPHALQHHKKCYVC
jgi:hypothetical protein